MNPDPTSKLTCERLASVSPAEAAAMLEAVLPPRLDYEVTHEIQYYGAAHLIADALGLKMVPQFGDVAWHHGPYLPPLWGLGELDPPIPAEEMDYPFHSASRQAVRLIVQKKEEPFFESLGCTRYLAVGAPYVYVPPQGIERIAGALLAMPSHSFAGGAHQRLESAREYAAYLASLRSHYPFIAVCLYSDDFTDAETRALYEGFGLPVIRGAAIRDMNSLRRQRSLFELFDCMTSNDIGSHAIYASATGCRVFLSGHSLFGEKEAIWSKHVFYQKRPNTMRNVLRWINPEWLRERWPWLYQGPENPTTNEAWAHEFLGTENKRSAGEMARLFGWCYPVAEESHASFVQHAPQLGWHDPQEASLKAKVEKLSARLEKDQARHDKESGKLTQRLEEIESSLTWKLFKPLLKLERSLRKRSPKKD